MAHLLKIAYAFPACFFKITRIHLHLSFPFKKYLYVVLCFCFNEPFLGIRVDIGHRAILVIKNSVHDIYDQGV